MGWKFLTLLYQYCGFTHPRLLKLQECVLEMRTVKSAVIFSTHPLIFIPGISKGKTSSCELPKEFGASCKNKLKTLASSPTVENKSVWSSSITGLISV